MKRVSKTQNQIIEREMKKKEKDKNEKKMTTVKRNKR